MLSTIVICATTVFCVADPAVAPQSSAAPQTATKTEAAKSSDTQTSPSQAKETNAPEKKSEPQPVVKKEPKLELLAIEQSIVDFTNAERVRFGLPAYVVDANLMTTARQHCSWMATYRQLVHTNIGVAENIAMGQPTSQDVVRCWMNSSGHRANILNGGNRRIGVAAYRTPEGTIFWCQQFAP